MLLKNLYFNLPFEQATEMLLAPGSKYFLFVNHFFSQRMPGPRTWGK